MKTAKRVRLFSLGIAIGFAIFLVAVWLKTTQEQTKLVRDPMLLISELLPLSAFPEFQADGTSTTKCDTQTETKFLSISASSLKDLHMGLNEITVEANDSCLRSGQAVILISKLQENTALFRATSLVRSAKGNQATLEIGNRWLGQDGFLAPSCFQFCDGLISQLTNDKNVVQLDLREKMYDADRPLTNSAAVSYGSTEVLLERISKAVGAIKNRDFVLIPRGPQIWRKNIVPVMQRLKADGARSVKWLYKGVSGLNRIPITPPFIDGVNEIHSFEASKEIGEGAIPLFVIHSDVDPKTVESRLPHSLIIVSSDPDIQPYVTPDQAYIEKGMTLFDLRRLPRDLSTKFIVYGESGFDWRAYHLAKELKRRGYKFVTYLRGGISEWEEALELSAVPQT